MQAKDEIQKVWPYQDEFLAGAQRLIERVCLRLGVKEPPRLGLVALAWWENEEFKHPPISSMDPGMLWNPKTSAWLDLVQGKASKFLEKPHALALALRRESAATAAFQEVIAEQLRAHDVEVSTVSLFSRAVRIAAYDCVLVLEFPRAAFEPWPHVVVSDPMFGHSIHVGLLKAVVDTLLDLLLGEAAKGTASRPWARIDKGEVDDLLRDAGRRLLGFVQSSLGWLSRGFFDSLNTISSLSYESASAIATIRLIQKDKLEGFELRFRKKVSLSDPVWARKILQLAKDPLHLLSDSVNFFGLSRENQDDKGGFRIRLKGLNQWELLHGNTILADVRLGIPSFPTPRLQRAEFEETFRRVFTNPNPEGEARIWKLIESILEAKHGALIVVTQNAALEAERLSSQSTGIEPTDLSDGAAARASAIDGAILLDPKGVCHAVGVILDGNAYSRETPSRGARFNSALRYIVQKDEEALERLAVVVSEDGNVDLLPRLRPQIRLSELLRALEQIGSHPEGTPMPQDLRALCTRILTQYFDYVPKADQERLLKGAIWDLDDVRGFIRTFDLHGSDIIEDIPDTQAGGSAAKR